MLGLEIEFHPIDEVVFKAPFDELVQDVGEHQLGDVHTGEVVRERLSQREDNEI
jgi:hypothetical protein